MKKKLMAAFVVLALLLALPVSASAASIHLQVTPSKNQVQVGDTVEYVITATGEDVVAMQFELQFPDGLSYVPNSGATPENLAMKLGVPAADWTEISSMFTFFNDVGITMAKGTELLRFTCKAEKAGTYGITLYELLPFDSNFQEFTPKVTVVPLEVKSQGGQTEPEVTQPSVPATQPTLPPATQPVETQPAVTTPVTQPQTTEPQATEPVEEVTTEPQEQPTVEAPTDATVPEQEPTEPEMTQEPTTQQGEEETVPEPTEEKKPSVLIWVLLGAVLAAGGATAGFFLLKKRK